MSTDHTLPFLPRGLLRVRAANPEFQQLIRNAEIILAADVRNPRNTWVVFLDPRLRPPDLRTAWVDGHWAYVLPEMGIGRSLSERKRMRGGKWKWYLP